MLTVYQNVNGKEFSVDENFLVQKLLSNYYQNKGTPVVASIIKENGKDAQRFIRRIFENKREIIELELKKLKQARKPAHQVPFKWGKRAEEMFDNDDYYYPDDYITDSKRTYVIPATMPFRWG